MIWQTGLMRFIVPGKMDDLPCSSKRIAVLGMDSFIGSHVFRALTAAGYDCIGTTRRVEKAGGKVLHLDLMDEASWSGLLKAKPDAGIAFFAISKLDQCEDDPFSHEINASRVPALLSALARGRCRPVFLSTNSIFGGDRPLCNEDAAVAPLIAYSCQKHEAEQRIQELVDGSTHAIVRITRTISAELPPFDGWLRRLRSGESIEAFDDFIFAPMTLPFVTAGLLEIALSTHDGIFHLSGTDVSYHGLASKIAAALGQKNMVHRTNSIAKGVSLRFRPSYSALGMRRTTALLGLQPQSASAVAEHLIDSPTLIP